MNGKGTIDEPYIIEDVYDFCAIADDEDKEVTYYKLKNSLDFNDHPDYKNGVKTHQLINAPKSVVDGDGREIRNLVVYNLSDDMGKNIIVLKQISNCKFPNLISYLTNNTLFVCEFIQCSFFIMISNSAAERIYGGCTFEKCTITFTGSTTTIFNFRDNVFINCNIIFNFNAPMDRSGAGFSYVFTNGKFDHTYFTGEMSLSNDSGYNYSTRYIFTSAELINVYYAVKCDPSGGHNYVANFYLANTTPSASCFYDKSLIAYSNCFNSTNIYALETDECKTTSVLTNKGFPVIAIRG